MPRFLIQIVVNLLTATIALMVAGAVIDGVTVRPAGIITAVAVFVIANALFAPFAFKMARKYAPAAIGGIGLISTLIALLIALCCRSSSRKGRSVSEHCRATKRPNLRNSLA